MSVKSKVTPKSVIEFLAPSAISSVVCLVASLIICLGVIYISRNHSASLMLAGSSSNVTIGSSHLSGTILHNSIVKNLPLIFFIILIIVAIYLLILDITKVVKTEKKTNTILKRLALRILVLIIWFPYLMLFFNSILSYSTRIAIFSTTASNTFLIAIYIVLSIIVNFIALHINVILLRLLALKSRLIELAF